VSGLNTKTARNIVSYRNENGVFNAREELKKVKGLGDKTFEQAAGFLRIPTAENPLDNSSVHPERYEFVISMAENLKTTVKKLIGNTQILRSVNQEQFVSDSIGIPTIEDIIGELEKPGRDPREKFTYAKFDEGINEIKDLSAGMRLEGTVTNVTNFGAFIDIGVHQDGLVHISELADTFVKDPTKVVKVGQVVSVTVISVDEELKRISLSMKTQMGPKNRKNEKSPGNDGKKTGSDTNKKRSSRNYKGDKKFVTAKPKFSLKQFMK
ncbi:MAG: S1 RNA-binding domain-containing protein, partial [Chitinispirillia bacterium]